MSAWAILMMKICVTLKDIFYCLEVLYATNSLQSQVPCFSIYIYVSKSSLTLINKVYVLGFL